eukprot:8873907-Lingulodinium_polyedra.AAC.1
MGVLAPPSGSIRLEVANRATAARQAYRQIGQQILAAGAITLVVKLTFARALVESKLFYNAC